MENQAIPKPHNRHKLKVAVLVLAILILLSLILEKISLTGFQIERFEYEGVVTTYLDFPREGAPTILFLHGAGASAVSYYRDFKLLSQKYHVIAPNIPIFGGSTVPADVWDFTNFARYFDKFLEEENLEQVIGIGHSFGGGILANLANVSDRLDYLILIDSAGGPVEKYDWERFWDDSLNTDLPQALDRSAETTLSAMKDLFTNILSNSLSISHIEDILEASIYTEYDYENVQIPVTILWGGIDDRTGFDISMGEYLDKNIPNSELIEVGGGHHWLLFEPERFFDLADALIQNFLIRI